MIATILINYAIAQGTESLSNHDFILKNELILKQILIDAHIPEYQYQIINTYYHDTRSFTEGLYFQDGLIYESTGLYGQSKLRKYELNNTKILKEYSLQKAYFGEGMTVLGEHLYQLTYREHIGFIYDKNSFQIKDKFSYPNEGWGLTTDDQQLIMSNGSDRLTFLDTLNMKVIRSLPVTACGKKISSLNELEYIDGMIYANVWPTSIIVIISPQNGNVQGWININALKPISSCFECVANGIAYNDKDKTVFVTGKNWPSLFAIKVSTPQKLIQNA